MFFNIIFGFLIPWLFGSWLYKKESNLVLHIAPFVAVLSFIVNELGILKGYWKLAPFYQMETLSVLPFNLGLYPVLGSWLIYIIKNKKIHPLLIISLFSVGITLVELIVVFSGKLVYGDGWNGFLTLFSYFVPFSLVYLYYLLVESQVGS